MQLLEEFPNLSLMNLFLNQKSTTVISFVEEETETVGVLLAILHDLGQTRFY